MPKRKYPTSEKICKKKQPSKKKKKKKRACVRTSPHIYIWSFGYPSLPKKRVSKAGKLYFREKDQRIVKINTQLTPTLVCEKDGCVKLAINDGIPTMWRKHGGDVSKIIHPHSVLFIYSSKLAWKHGDPPGGFSKKKRRRNSLCCA